MSKQMAPTRAAVLVPRGTTLIAVVMDRSGSMEAIRNEMETAFAEFIGGQRRASGACAVSLYQFDDSFEAVYEGVPLAAVPSLKLDPRGSTALHDAIARAITTVRKADPDHVVMVIITDGEENASREYKGAEGARKIGQMIMRRKLADGWEFVFLGAGLDDIAAAAGSRAIPITSVGPALSSAGEIALAIRDRADAD
jgi:Mg-chelatase subunit ChlD